MNDFAETGTVSSREMKTCHSETGAGGGGEGTIAQSENIRFIQLGGML